jgi:hypothetical protein
MIEQIDGQTPNGGSYALVYYFDADGTPVPKAEAVKAEIVEFSAQDKPIAVSFVEFMGEDT